MASDENHLLVFGASGISGWACVKEALTYPTKTTFTKVTGLTNRPLSLQDSKLPQDPRLQLISGIDFTNNVKNIVSLMVEKIPSIDTVTHAIFTAYIQTEDFDSLRDINTKLVKNAADALDQVAPKLKSFVLQTGGKGYGVEFPDKVEIKAPLKESLPRIPKPYYDNIFYYTQYDSLKEMTASKSWTFTEIRPDVIIGFVPNSNAMNCAQGLGLWLSLYREVHGSGAKIPFPGTPKSYKNKHTDTFQDILGRMEIYAAVNHDKCGNGSVFNVADGEVVTWADKWPGICESFDLEGTGPGAEPYSIEDFIKQNEGTWQKILQKHGLKDEILEKFSWPFLHFVISVFNFNRQYDLSAARGVGFEEKIDTVEGYRTAFERMREAGIIPYGRVDEPHENGPIELAL